MYQKAVDLLQTAIVLKHSSSNEGQLPELLEIFAVSPHSALLAHHCA